MLSTIRTMNNRAASCSPAGNRSRSYSVRAYATGSKMNLDIRKNEEKVVDFVKVEDLKAPKAVYCRCWRSGTFPMCDGAHVKHNKETGDNVGPLVLERAAADK
mmetsp:Transcript_2664/g.6766  ORF Transcript_2664/g.6766 Transcript_2664/m.6766 type:complete len:103 (-) Transcript_2664:646-954(-)